MKRIIQIVEQIEHSKSLILKGSESDLRMALLLLDNAAEIMMFRVIKSIISHSDMYEKMLKHFPAHLEDEEGKKLFCEFKKKTISGIERKKMEKFFHEKVNFLSGERIREVYYKEKIIPTERAAVLKAIHLYRNEIYHRDYIRKETLRHSTLILYEITCDLFIPLTNSAGGSSMSSNDGERIEKFRQRLGLGQGGFLNEKEYEHIRTHLKSGIEITAKDLAVGLKEHLLERIDGTREALEFIRRDGFDVPSSDEALKKVLFFENIVGKKPLKDFKKQLTEYVPPYSVDFLESLEQRVEAMGQEKEKLKIFVMFAQLESEFEPLEKIIDKAACELDAAIEAEIDRMRGK